MTRALRLWSCCSWPSPCFGGCSGGFWIWAEVCADCGELVRDRHARLCPLLARTAPRGGAS